MERAFLGLDPKGKVSYNINISGLWKVLHTFPPTYILWVLSESKTSFLVSKVLY